MQLRKETFRGSNDSFYSDFEKIYYENGLLKSEWNDCISSGFDYDKDGEILNKTVTMDNGQGNNFFKSEYKHEGLTTRIFHYQIGYTDLESFYDPDEQYPNLSRMRDGNIPIYPLNELLSIEELIYNENKKVISRKKTDLTNNSFSGVKNSFDSLGNLIKSVSTENGIITSNSIYNYKDGVLDSYTVDNAISYLKYNERGNVVEIDCFEMLDGIETFDSKVVLEYMKNKLISVYYNTSDEESYTPNELLTFFEWEKLFEKGNETLLNLNHILHSEYRYGQKKYEVKFIYNSKNEIIQSTLLNTKSKNKKELDSNGNEHTIFFNEITEENRFFMYKYNESFINHPIEYIDGFTIKENKIEHLFTHKFEYHN